jgi:transposase-like protein
VNNTNTKPVLTGDIYDAQSFADADRSGSIDLGHYQTNREANYQMPIQAAEVPKTKSQIYYEEVEALKTGGATNADAIREVAKKHSANENAVRGGIHQFKSRHLNGGSAATTSRRTRRATPTTVDDYLATARAALEAARDLIDQDVAQAKARLDAAQQRYDEAVASVKERKADIEKRLKALQ